MKEKLMKEIQQAMNGKLSDRQKEQLMTAMRSCLQKYQISEPVSSVENAQEANNRLLTMFISAKQIEGCSGKTVIYYQETISRFFDWIKKEVTLIDTDDLRLYLAEYQQGRNVSKVTIDNIRRILSSFFAWLEDEDYIVKSPVRRIHRIKTAKIIKEARRNECGNDHSDHDIFRHWLLPLIRRFSARQSQPSGRPYPASCAQDRTPSARPLCKPAPDNLYF